MNESMTIQEQIKEGVGTVVCIACENGNHGDYAVAAKFCCCPCHGNQLDAERVDDARECTGEHLDSALNAVGDVNEQLRRAHRDACEFEPVAAMVILPLIEDARRIEQRLAELIQLRV